MWLALLRSLLGTYLSTRRRLSGSVKTSKGTSSNSSPSAKKGFERFRSCWI